MEISNELRTQLAEIEQRLRHRGYHRMHPFAQALFSDAVEEWCKMMGWPIPKQDLLPLFQEHISRVAYCISSAAREKKAKTSLTAKVASLGKSIATSLSGDLDTLENDYFLATYEAVFQMELTDILLLALSVAAIGAATFHAVSAARKQRPPMSTSISHVPTPDKRTPRTWSLVLVVNAENDIVKALQQNPIEEIESDKLYQATQSLWLDEDFRFEKSLLPQWFDEKRSVAKQSEYDVHLIRIELPQDEPGLHREANQMDRLDAFRRLRRMALNTTISPRLPSDAYGTTNVFYKR